MDTNGSGSGIGGHAPSASDRPTYEAVPSERLPFDATVSAATDSTHPLQTAGSLPPGMFK